MFSKLFKKNRKYMHELTTRILCLDLETGWIEDATILEPLTFIKEKNGKGALQLSIITFDDQRRPTIEELLESEKKDYEIKEYKVREWSVYGFDEETSEFYRKNFYFVKTHVVVYISYYGSPTSKGSNELKEAVKISHSVSVINKN
jgi:hypothetical protein